MNRMNTPNQNNSSNSQKGNNDKSPPDSEKTTVLGEWFSVETFRDKTKKTIDISTIKTSSDLAALKATDPFLYYSIPGVKDSALLGRRVDPSTIAAASAGSVSTVVERLSKISFEKSDCEMLPDAMAELATGRPVEEDLYMSFLDDIYKQ
jgi:hypothetical protein